MSKTAELTEALRNDLSRLLAVASFLHPVSLDPELLSYAQKAIEAYEDDPSLSALCPDPAERDRLYTVLMLETGFALAAVSHSAPELLETGFEEELILQGPEKMMIPLFSQLLGLNEKERDLLIAEVCDCALKHLPSFKDTDAFYTEVYRLGAQLCLSNIGDLPEA
ncbi:MAG: hypothetical protein IKE21_03420 [Erysipelotrichaceae bacterium]|nr:hypothetical protein [Erysipelotrichaceae bacterium]